MLIPPLFGIPYKRVCKSQFSWIHEHILYNPTQRPPTSRISHLNELREKVTNGICPYSYNKFGV